MGECKGTLSRLLAGKHIRSGEIRTLVAGIFRTLERMEGYLLKEGHILLEPDYIYVEPEEFQVWLCLVPGLERDFPEMFGKLLEYLLGRVDHQDKESVVLAYGLYQETRTENFGADDILKYLYGSDPGRQEAGKTEIGKAAGSRDNAELFGDAGLWKNGGMAECADGGLWPQEAWDLPAGKKLPEPESGRKRKKEKRKRKEGGGILARIRACFHKEKKQAPLPDDGGWEQMFREEPAGPERSGERLSGQEDFHWDFGSMGKVNRAPAAEGRVVEPAVSRAPLAAGPQAVRQMAVGSPSGGPSAVSSAAEQDSMTVFLGDIQNGPAVRKLRALDEDLEDIPIAYYPFVIGKQERLVDYQLKKDTVSRLHLRIDRDGDRYQAQDLNSTNGTCIGGRLLENNETADLSPGDEVQIANCRFRFE